MNSKQPQLRPTAWYLGLDYGGKRIGVALGDSLTRLARPLVTLANDGSVVERLGRLIEEYRPAELVVGLPRSLEGQETGQSQLVRRFVHEHLEPIGVPVVLQDEALTTQAAAEQMKPQQQRRDGEIDRRAAAIILQDRLDVL